MKFTIEKEDGIATFTVTGSLDTTNAHTLKSEFVVQNASGVKHFVIDLTQLDNIDSSGLSSLLIAARLSAESHGSTHVIEEHGMVERLMDISNFYDMFRKVFTKDIVPPALSTKNSTYGYLTRDTQVSGDTAQVKLSGKINVLEAPALLKECEKLLSQGTNSIELDLKFVTFIDSNGLAVLVKVTKMCRNIGGELALVHVNGYAKRLIKLSEIDAILHIKGRVDYLRN